MAADARSPTHGDQIYILPVSLLESELALKREFLDIAERLRVESAGTTCST